MSVELALDRTLARVGILLWYSLNAHISMVSHNRPVIVPPRRCICLVQPVVIMLCACLACSTIQPHYLLFCAELLTGPYETTVPG